MPNNNEEVNAFVTNLMAQGRRGLEDLSTTEKIGGVASGLGRGFLLAAGRPDPGSRLEQIQRQKLFQQRTGLGAANLASQQNIAQSRQQLAALTASLSAIEKFDDPEQAAVAIDLLHNAIGIEKPKNLDALVQIAREHKAESRRLIDSLGGGKQLDLQGIMALSEIFGGNTKAFQAAVGVMSPKSPKKIDAFTDANGNRILVFQTEGQGLGMKNLGPTRDRQSFSLGKFRANLSKRANKLKTGDPDIDRMKPDTARAVLGDLNKTDFLTQLLRTQQGKSQSPEKEADSFFEGL